MGLGQRALQPDNWGSAEEPLDSARCSLQDTSGPPGGAGMNLASLARAIDAEVIPRLVLARRASAAAFPEDEIATGVPVPPSEVAAFTRLVLECDVTVAAERIAALRAGGISLETIFLDLLGPTARCLGDMWNEDLCDFTQVTVGLWRLQQIVRDLSPAFCDSVQPQDNARRALLVPTPGEQHTFGLFIVAEFFRRDGWDVIDAPFPSVDDLAVAVRRDWYAVVGLSIGAERWIDRLAASVRRVRQASLNTGVGIIVGGPLFHDQPDLAARVGADAFALDAPGAVACARSLLRTGAPLC